MLVEGRRVPRDESAGAGWLTRAADGGNAFAQAWLGDAHIKGDVVASDPARAAAWYRKAAQNGHFGAAAVLAKLKLDSVENDFERWLALAERSDPQAQRIVGEAYLNGNGVAREMDSALYWLRSAADRKNSAAMVILGVLEVQGVEVPTDSVSAVARFRGAATQGNADAEYNLGVCYRRGIGVERNDMEARRWYECAAEKGQPSAIRALADLVAEVGTKDLVSTH